MVELTGQTLCDRCRHEAECAFGRDILADAVARINKLAALSGRKFGADEVRIECCLFNGRRDWRVSG